MTKADLIKNGITVKKLTSMMRREERLINYYNTKYEYQIEEEASPKEQAEYQGALNRWDAAKQHRDLLNQ